MIRFNFTSEDILEIRTKMGMDRYAFARVFNVTYGAVYYWENGKMPQGLPAMLLSMLCNLKGYTKLEELGKRISERFNNPAGDGITEVYAIGSILAEISGAELKKRIVDIGTDHLGYK